MLKDLNLEGKFLVKQVIVSKDAPAHASSETVWLRPVIKDDIVSGMASRMEGPLYIIYERTGGNIPMETGEGSTINSKTSYLVATVVEERFQPNAVSKYLNVTGYTAVGLYDLSLPADLIM